MKTPWLAVVTALVAVATGSPARAALFDQWKSALTTTNASATNPLLTSVALGALSQEQMTGGLKEALGKGVEHAIAMLGRSNGFLTNLLRSL